LKRLWGLAQAPASFGGFSGATLVGNFGDRMINAYGAHTGAWLGTSKDTTIVDCVSMVCGAFVWQR
jgi:hypothetical protein